jgi:hypothetical protein
VSQTIESLTASTTYHYRLVAVSEAGTSYSRDLTFKTS